jgi:hypothetical protein
MEDTATAGPAAPAGPGVRWVKSSHSFSNGNCVEVAVLPGGQVGVRHSRHTAGPVLRFPAAEWRAFLTAARSGTFDQPATRH